MTIKVLVLVLALQNAVSATSFLKKRQTIGDRVCPSTNICGDGVCQVTTHPSFEYQYVCKCNDGTYRFKECPQSCRINPCMNGGVCTSTGCVCGSGFSGDFCNILTSSKLCDNINCKNSGVCNIVRADMAECWCPSGYGGYYCELRNAGNRCSFVSCLNGGTCEEQQPGSTSYAYCMCKAGYTGTRCETEYFRCNQNGLFVDRNGCDTGHYFSCSSYGTISAPNGVLTRLPCPPGLRFNAELVRCDYSRNVQC